MWLIVAEFYSNQFAIPKHQEAIGSILQKWCSHTKPPRVGLGRMGYYLGWTWKCKQPNSSQASKAHGLLVILMCFMFVYSLRKTCCRFVHVTKTVSTVKLTNKVEIRYSIIPVPPPRKSGTGIIHMYMAYFIPVSMFPKRSLKLRKQSWIAPFVFLPPFRFFAVRSTSHQLQLPA